MAEESVEFTGWFVGPNYVTEVWFSPAAKRFLRKKGEEAFAFLQKLESVAEAGFDLFTGEGKPIRAYGGGVYRIGIRRSMIRIVGFYDEPKISFLGVTGFVKKGQKQSAHERDLIEEVSELKESRAWTKKS